MKILKKQSQVRRGEGGTDRGTRRMHGYRYGLGVCGQRHYEVVPSVEGKSEVLLILFIRLLIHSFVYSFIC